MNQQQQRKARQRQEYLAQRQQQVLDMRAIKQMLQSRGWKLFEQMLEGHEDNARREFKAGERSPELFQAECIIQDWIRDGIRDLIERGEAAQDELRRFGEEESADA